MIAIWTLCAWVAWTPAWNLTLERDTEFHYFYEDDLPGIVAWNSQQEVCRADYDVPHTYSVAGFVTDSKGELRIGPESDDLTVIWPVPEPGQTVTLLAGALLLFALGKKRKV
ncbi:hypothetical protein LCGC14_1683530 [marine sediment metagenome]|uniref:PEP-CTERM protein-sorting domain-containing protein n=1 Tax=marine sediment metagenome TaxID=412755 RepID=A0A0F9HNE8_9ZZZZ